MSNEKLYAFSLESSYAPLNQPHSREKATFYLLLLEWLFCTLLAFFFGAYHTMGVCSASRRESTVQCCDFLCLLLLWGTALSKVLVAVFIRCQCCEASNRCQKQGFKMYSCCTSAASQAMLNQDGNHTYIWNIVSAFPQCFINLIALHLFNLWAICSIF